MTKVVFAVCVLLTLGAGYLTAYDVGVVDSAAKQVRKGAVHGGGGTGIRGSRGGFRVGK